MRKISESKSLGLDFLGHGSHNKQGLSTGQHNTI